MDNTLQSDERGIILPCPQCGQRNRIAYAKLGQTGRCGTCQAELKAPAAPVDIENVVNFDALVARSPLPVLVDFWAPWCGPCKMIAPHLLKVAAEGAGQWLVAKVNTDTVPELSQRFQINAIPLMIVFKNGREMARQAGAMAAPAIANFVRQAL